jgi:eukaryotic-like serine/threonine-protein kinase
VDAQTGALKWTVILPCNEFGEPTLAFNTIYIGTSLNQGTTGTVYALNEVSGKVIWHLTTGGGVWRAIAVDANAQTVFAAVGDPGFQILALDAMTGASKWQIQVPSSSEDLDPGSAMVFANGLVYFSDKNGYVYALHESDGSVAWATQITKISADDVSTPAIGANGVLYVGSLDSLFYALNATTGAVIWKASSVGALDSSPAIANGVVYFASFNSKIYALNAATHAVLWTFTTGGKSFSSPIVVNGWLYCGSDDGKLYAFSL